MTLELWEKKKKGWNSMFVILRYPTAYPERINNGWNHPYGSGVSVYVQPPRDEHTV